jgi:hypothetical protein
MVASSKAQDEARKAGTPDKIQSIGKSEQNAKKRLKDIANAPSILDED